MIYDLFVNFVMGDSEEALSLLAASPKLQYALALGGFACAVCFLIITLYAFLVLFRGWK